MSVHARFVERLRHSTQSGFLRSVLLLVGGTAAAQVIWFAATPLLTRLYTAADFSVFGAFVALMSMLSIIACFGYDNAIVVPERDEDGASVLVLSLLLAACVAAATALGLVATNWIPPVVAERLLGDLAPFMWALAPIVLLAGAFSALQFWASRSKQFARVARVRVAQAAAGVGTQMGAGLAGVSPLGLIAGQGVNFLLGAGLLGGRALGELRITAASVRLGSLRTVAWRYRNFALMTTPALLANSAAVQVPVLVVAGAGRTAEAGFLFLAMRVMQAPLATIGAAVSQVYYTEAPQAWRDGRLPQLTHNVLRRLAQVGLGPLLFAGIVGQPAFAIVFGQGWGRAGEIVAWMIPWLALQFLASPISMLLYALERQRTDLWLQLFGMAVRIGPVLAAATFAPQWLPEVFALTGAVFYAVYLLVLRRVVGLSWRSLGHAIASARWLVLAWCVLGVAVLAVLRAGGWADT
jgi:O-antigen/teichoic acid export membrane protein